MSAERDLNQNFKSQQGLKQEINDLARIVLEKIDIVELISEYCSLKKVGQNYFTNCPFHHETKPSFSVSPEKQIFKCFGCGVSGNAIKFYQKYHNLSYIQAVIELAKKAGLDIGVDINHLKKIDQKINLYERVMNYVANLYHTFLIKNREHSIKAWEYLKQREIDENVIYEFKIGYASPVKNTLVKKLKKISEEYGKEVVEVALELGVIVERKGELFDFFSDTIIFPVLSEDKTKVLGLLARTPSEGLDKIGSKLPKYLSLKESSYFQKGSILYGLNLTEEIKKEGWGLIVEGIFDLLTLYNRGIKNVVATLSCQATFEQLKHCAQIADTWYLAYDRDKAGIAGTISVIEGLVRFNCCPYYLIYPEKDPDLWLRKINLQKDELKKVLEESKISGVALLRSYLAGQGLSESKVYNQILKIFSLASNDLILKEFSKEISSEFSIPEEIVFKSLLEIKNARYKKTIEQYEFLETKNEKANKMSLNNGNKFKNNNGFTRNNYEEKYFKNYHPRTNYNKAKQWGKDNSFSNFGIPTTAFANKVVTDRQIISLAKHIISFPEIAFQWKDNLMDYITMLEEKIGLNSNFFTNNGNGNGNGDGDGNNGKNENHFSIYVENDDIREVLLTLKEFLYGELDNYAFIEKLPEKFRQEVVFSFSTDLLEEKENFLSFLQYLKIKKELEKAKEDIFSHEDLLKEVFKAYSCK